ncbi:hypothetical protein [Streptomyces sp. NPDC001876]|uniref:hypothetical protein n=1 Tax=Streptomyces sp. NPDC001876 TaxID=3154402 RepID=UPI00331A965E
MMPTPLVPGILGMGELVLEGHDDRTGRRARDDRPTSGSLTPPGPCPPSNRWGCER